MPTSITVGLLHFTLKTAMFTLNIIITIIYLFWSKWHGKSMLIFILLQFYLFLTLLYYIINNISGSGLNDAFFYHMNTGIEGINITDFAAMFLFEIGIYLLGIFLVIMQYKVLPFARATSISAIIVSFIVVMAHPLLWDIYENRSEIGFMDESYEAESEIDAEPYINLLSFPNLSSLSASEERLPNLVWIYLESVEANLILENQEIAPFIANALKQELSFSGMYEVDGTGWTIAGIVGSQCGVPLVLPDGQQNSALIEAFMPKATCVGDVLKSYGYELLKIQGSAAAFAGANYFFAQHGFDSVYDNTKIIPLFFNRPEVNSWGLFDSELFEFARYQYDYMQNKQTKFALFISTIDTHPPGFNPVNDDSTSGSDAKNPILNALGRLDSTVSAFVEHVAQSDEPALIVLQSDHLIMGKNKNILNQQDFRPLLFVIINASNDVKKRFLKRDATVFDVGPTVLNIMGIPVQEIGLGRSLISDNLTLAEKYGVELNTIIKKIKPYLFDLWDFPKISDIEINIHDSSVHFGSSVNYKIPILFKVSTNDEVYPYLALDRHRYEFLKDFEFGTGFIWADQCELIEVLGSHDFTRGPAEYCLGVGRLGGHVTILRIGSDTDRFDLNFSQALRKSLGSIDNYKTSLSHEIYDKQITSLNEIANRSSLWTKIWNRMSSHFSRFYKSFNFQINDASLNVLTEFDSIETSSQEAVNYRSDVLPKVASKLFIAHAGGKIDGFTYTNSLEALNKSYQNGFRYFELDIEETFDNKLVAVHDWNSWKNRTDYMGKLIPTKDEFLKLKIDGVYTPMDMNAINAWFSVHQDAFLVTDKINKPNRFAEAFVDKSRLIMELFTVSAIKEANQIGISVLMHGNLLSDPSIRSALVQQKVSIDGITIDHREAENHKNILSSLVKKGLHVVGFNLHTLDYDTENYVLCEKSDYISGVYASSWDFSNNLTCE